MNRNAAEPAMSRILRQAAVNADAGFDKATMRELIRAASVVGTAASYPRPSNEAVYNIEDRELTFIARPDLSRAVTDKKPAVLSALNGLGANAADYVGGDEELLRDVVMSQIRPFGVSAGELRVDHNTDVGVAVQIGGMTTVPAVGTVHPGDTLEIYVPRPSEMSVGNAGFHRDGTPNEKMTLTTRAMNPTNAGLRLRRTIVEILNRPEAWKDAMDQRNRRNRAWYVAANQVMDSYLAAVALGAYVLIKAGYLTATDKLDTKASTEGEDFAAGLAQLLGLVPTRPVEMGWRDNDRMKAQLLRHRLLSTIFWNGENTTFEFGRLSAPNGEFRDHMARYNTAEMRIKERNPYGELLTVQLNHFTLGVTAFHQAIQQQYEFTLGKATSGTGARGFNAVHVMLARP